MDVEDLRGKYNIDRDSMKKIEIRYGSIDSFGKIYVEKLLRGNVDCMKLPRRLNDKLIKYFDLSEPDGIGRNQEYAKFINDVFNLKYGFIIKGPTKSVIDDILRNNFSNLERSVVEYVYKLNIKNESLETQGFSREKIYKINDTVKAKLRKMNKSGLLNNILFFDDDAKSIIKQFFEDENVFFDRANVKDRERKLKLIYIMYENEINKLDIVDNPSYISQVSNLEKQIKCSILDQNRINLLVEKIKTKKNVIAREHEDELMNLFMKRISSRRMIDIFNISVKELGYTEKKNSTLSRKGIDTIYDIANLDTKDLEDICISARINFNTMIENLKELGVKIPKDSNVMILEHNEFPKELPIDNDVFDEILAYEIKESELNKGAKQKLRKELKGEKNNTKKLDQKDMLKYFMNQILIGRGFPYCDMTLERLGLSQKVKGKLKNYEVVGDLIEKSEDDLRSITGVGNKIFAEIKEKLELLGFEFPENRRLSILGANKDKIQPNRFKLDINIISSEIKTAQIKDEEKSYLLKLLTQRAIYDLGYDYDKLEKEISEYNKLKKYASCIPEEERSDSKVDDDIKRVKKEQKAIRIEMERLNRE